MINRWLVSGCPIGIYQLSFYGGVKVIRQRERGAQQRGERR